MSCFTCLFLIYLHAFSSNIYAKSSKNAYQGEKIIFKDILFLNYCDGKIMKSNWLMKMAAIFHEISLMHPM